MPTIEVTTKSARSVWKSPDGQREIIEVALDHDGQLIKAKTYSKDISIEGWHGTVESYEKDGRNGPETFVKQPQKDFTPGSGYGTGRQPSSTVGKYQPKDEAAIKAMWAIGQAMGSVNQGVVDYDHDNVASLAKELFALVDEVKTGEKVEDIGEEDLNKLFDDIPKEESAWNK